MTSTAVDRIRKGYSHWDMVTFGWKYNMDNLHAALLLPQLERIGVNSARREELARLYEDLLTDIPGLSWPRPLPDSYHARHLFTVQVGAGQRDDTIAQLAGRKIGVAVNYRAIHLLTYFRQTCGYGPGRFPNAERIGNETLTLPFYPLMSDEDVRTVTGALREILSGRDRPGSGMGLPQQAEALPIVNEADPRLPGQLKQPLLP
jgi:UDP-4-amino-4-deoxy-L-arabinose-oxoglutarate aminotransferase